MSKSKEEIFDRIFLKMDKIENDLNHIIEMSKAIERKLQDCENKNNN